MSANESRSDDFFIGTGLSTSAAPGSDPVADAVAAEERGYDFVSISDHPVGDHPSFETLTLLTWIAARTTRIGVASRVLGVPFRRPALVAKAAESLQRLSGGRLVLGLGGGYSDDEIAAVGSVPLTPRQKVDGLAEAITLLRAAWTGGAVDLAGTQYPASGLRLTPRPDTPIPIWLGTYGPRALAVTGRLADGWIPSLGHATPAAIPAMLDRIRTAAVDAGRSPDAVRPVFNVSLRLDAHGASSGDVLVGTAGEVVEQLGAFVELGFRGVNLAPEPGQEAAVAAEVLPALRASVSARAGRVDG